MEIPTADAWSLPAPLVEPDEAGNYSQSREAETAWMGSVRKALSRGAISRVEAEARGYRGCGHDAADFNGGWRPLPPVLYHVTTAAREVARTGIKTRDELRQESGVGLGGGESDTISFTSNKKTAEDILRALVELRAIVRGERTIRDLIAEARSGVDAPGPFLDSFLRLADMKPGADGDLPVKLRLLMQGKGLEHGHLATVAEAPPGWRPAAGIAGITFADKEVFYVWERPLSSKERTYRSTQLARAFLAARDFAGGPEDPLFFCADFDKLGRTQKQDLQILKFRPKPGAQGYALGSLSEWRTCDGTAVELVGHEQELRTRPPQGPLLDL